MSNPVDIFKALADDVRLRALRALGTAELSVAELVDILELPQSTVSRHLKPLREAELVETRRDGTSVYYRSGPLFRSAEWASILKAELKSVPGREQDRAAVRKILDKRRKKSREFFDRVAGSYHELTEPGGGWRALAAALAAGYAGRHVVDIGAGEGDLTLMLARFASAVTAVDLSQQMLKVIEERAEENGVGGRVTAAMGDIEALPLTDEVADAVFISQCLHHATQPENAIREAARVLKRNGHLVIIDLIRHRHEWVKEQMADIWLGFDETDVGIWMRNAGFDVRVVQPLPGAMPGLAVLLAFGIKQ